MKVSDAPLCGLKWIDPAVNGDSRGAFYESFHRNRFEARGLPGSFIQDNVSVCEGPVLRGLHLQNPKPQAKLVSVVEGNIWDVVVDVRLGSPTFGKWCATELSATNHRHLFIPEGLAHGFLCLSERTVVLYKCGEFYAPEHEITVLWNDPDIAIPWPESGFILSEKDRMGIRLADIAKKDLPVFSGEG